jgi:hypothetical protein
MNADPSASQHASRPGIATYVILAACLIGGFVLVYGESLQKLLGFS